MSQFTKLKVELTNKEILNDYYIAILSRNLSLIGRKEALNGRAKFGIFGDGKEIAQLALAKQFKAGDWRSGYYRDQTWMMASGMFSGEEFFAQLFGDTDLKVNPSNGGRLMNNHFASRSLESDGTWKEISKIKNSSCDISPTAAQMPRLLGLAYASKIFRNNPALESFTQFSVKGSEVAFGTIGDASTSEGHFFETMNAAGVLQVPMAISVWDDDYGISVHKSYQTTKQNISSLLKGFEKDKEGDGFLIYKAKGWDYPALVNIYSEAIAICREKHIPVLFHITEMTQPQGHSSSGSHERYKSPERLLWEAEFDPIIKMREWIIETGIALDSELKEIEEKAIKQAGIDKKKAWEKYTGPIKSDREDLLSIIRNKTCVCSQNNDSKIKDLITFLEGEPAYTKKTNISAARKILRHVCLSCSRTKGLKSNLLYWLKLKEKINYIDYNSKLYSDFDSSALNKKSVKVVYSENSPMVNGREVLRDNFDMLFEKYPLLLTFGEDTGKIGGVNQSLEGLQKKYGEIRITDTGIRETTIVGQAIGLALRGLRPIAEIQYFDYLLYAIQTLSDDLATMLYRTIGGQKAPVIIRTRGHRLEGVWHSGSPLSMVINSVRGMYVCVPRNMTKAASFYNLLLESDDPALVIEPLNAYRLKEKRPENMGEFMQELGVPEILNEGEDVTLVTYGSCVRIAQDAVEQLKEFGISVELIDVQTLLPFDKNRIITESIKKTGKVLFFDEDVPGGATAFMMQKVVEEQKAFYYLDAPPKTLSAKEHRPAYATDGDYFSNPNAEDVFESVYSMMYETNPEKYPEIYPD
jgi:pyruvate/2-oxoglutarate/acetoin dehydrogenase E1 component/TPP-dependent pyruvate/acetoin dehydrogenase alpha subunit